MEKGRAPDLPWSTAKRKPSRKAGCYQGGLEHKREHPRSAHAGRTGSGRSPATRARGREGGRRPTDQGTRKDDGVETCEAGSRRPANCPTVQDSRPHHREQTRLGRSDEYSLEGVRGSPDEADELGGGGPCQTPGAARESNTTNGGDGARVRRPVPRAMR